MIRREAGIHRKRKAAIVAIAGSIIVAGTGSAVWANNATPADHTTPAPLAVSSKLNPSKAPRLGAIPVVTSGKRVAMPLDPYMTSTSDIKLISDATSLKARDCMRSLGFANWKTDTVTTSKPGDGNDFDLLDYLDPAAAKNGYPQTLTAKGAPAGQAQPLSRPKAPVHVPDGVRAYMGTEAHTASGHAVPVGGCDAEGGRQVRVGSAELPMDPRVLEMLSQSAAVRDGRMQSAFASWSSCMARSGYHYTNPFRAQHDVRWGLRTAAEPAGAAEKAVASADAICQKDINLVGTYKALEYGYEQNYVDQHRTTLIRSLAIFHKWTAKAKAVIAKG